VTILKDRPYPFPPGRNTSAASRKPWNST